MMAGMADPSHGPKPLRVLLSEGTSTSAREAITILGLAGHIVEVCDPSPVCLGRFSRFVGKFHRCPGLARRSGRFPGIRREAAGGAVIRCAAADSRTGIFVRAGAGSGSKRRVGLALPDFESYRTAHSKAGFSRLLDELGLPQPATRIVKSASELRDAIRFPCVVKTSIGTASRGIWFVRDDGGLDAGAAGTRRERCVRRRGAGAGSGRGRDRKSAGGVLPRQAARLSCLPANCRRRRRRRGDQAKRAPAACARRCRNDRRAARLARRVVGRLHHAGRGHAPLHRLQPAAGRADERLSRRARSGRSAAAGLAGRNADGRCRTAARACGPISPCRRCSAAQRAAERGERFFASACVSPPDADPMPTASRN